MTQPTAIEVSVSRIEPDADLETIAAAISDVEALKQVVAAAEKDMKQRCIAWIETNAQPIDVGAIRYTVGYRKDVKCRNVRETLEALLKITRGDFDQVVACLSSSAIKHGAARKLLSQAGQPDEFDRLFETVEVAALKGEPREKELLKLDTRFLAR